MAFAIICSLKLHTLGPHIDRHAFDKPLYIPHQMVCGFLIHCEIHIVFRRSTLVMAMSQYLRPLALHPLSHH